MSCPNCGGSLILKKEIARGYCLNCEEKKTRKEPPPESHDEKSLATQMQEQIAEQLFPLFDSVLDERAKHYEKNPGSVPRPAELDRLIKAYARQCSFLVGGCNLIPGPWGLLAIVPEIMGVMKFQLEMIYDIGRAYGCKKITRELLLGILLSGSGSGAGGLIVIQGSKVAVKRASLRMIQKLVQALGGKVTQKLIKSVLAKWIPLVGAAVLATWSYYSTTKLGENACQILSKDVVFDEGAVIDVDGAEVPVIPAEDMVEPPSATAEHIKLLIALMHVDRQASTHEREFIEPLLANCGLPVETQAELEALLETAITPEINYEAFKGQPEEGLVIMMDLVGLAKADGRLHPAEKMFLRRVGERFGFTSQEVDELLAAD